MGRPHHILLAPSFVTSPPVEELFFRPQYLGLASNISMISKYGQLETLLRMRFLKQGRFATRFRRHAPFGNYLFLAEAMLDLFFHQQLSTLEPFLPTPIYFSGSWSI